MCSLRERCAYENKSNKKSQRARRAEEVVEEDEAPRRSVFEQAFFEALELQRKGNS